LQDRTIIGVYDRDTINNYIYADTNIIEALATMRETNQEIAAVVNSKRIAVGVITLSDIEHHVATAVLNQARAKGLK
jgi:CBS domain-containing protein